MKGLGVVQQFSGKTAITNRLEGYKGGNFSNKFAVGGLVNTPRPAEKQTPQQVAATSGTNTDTEETKKCDTMCYAKWAGLGLLLVLGFLVITRKIKFL